MSVNVFVSNLSSETTAESLQTLFAEAGGVLSVTLASRPGALSATVVMETEDAAAAAVKLLNGKFTDGNSLIVSRKQPKPDAPRKGNRGAIGGF